MRIALWTLTFACGLTVLTHACTSFMAGPGTTQDGSIWVGQSDDEEGAGDARLVKVPAMDWPKGSMRPIVDYGNYPRYVGTERKVAAYYPSPIMPNKTDNIIGEIPQVSHTYGYLEGNYAFSNEEGLAFGESTCSARTFALKKPQGPSLLSMYELTRLAAERTNKARAAVLVMGSLAEKYGFYGDPDAETGGESLLLADADEQWIFHILAESSEKGGAIWAAQRVPRDHITVVANAFVIAEVNATDSDNFLFSSNMHSVAKQNGWWDGKGSLHFTRAFSGGEYTSRHYSGRRMYAIYRALAPSAKVPANYTSYKQAIGDTYPVSAKPDKLLVPSDVLTTVYRNYYQGTPYDMSKQRAAGPFGNPTRLKYGAGEAALGGYHWERPIAVWRTTMIYQTNIRPALPKEKRNVAWFMPSAALTGVWTPTYPSTSEVAHALAAPHHIKVDRTTISWASRELGQFVYPRWNKVKSHVSKMATELENKALDLVSMLDKEQDLAKMSDATNKHATDVVSQWRSLYDDLLVEFSDGWDYQGYPKFAAVHKGYPEWWLNEVGYKEGTLACNPVCP